MKIYVRIIVVVAALLQFSSCRKELDFEQSEPFDTIFPKSYLPVYPGSWWTYYDSTSNSSFTDVAGAYELKSFNYDNHHSRQYYVPSWRNRFYFGYGFQQNATFFTKELEETVASGWLYLPNTSTDCIHTPCTSISRKVEAVGLTVIIDTITYSNVIRVREDVHQSGYWYGGIYYYYYAKDVGLIKKEFSDHRVDYQLMAYDINH